MNSGQKGNCTIRHMRPADIDSVLRIAAGLNDAPDWPASIYFAALDPNHSPPRVTLVAESRSAGEVIGFAVSSIVPPQAELESIAVRPDQQRRGIGRRMLAELVSELKAAAVNEILLEVRASNCVAREFYVSEGWRQTGIRPCYYGDPKDDAILMSRKLG